MPLCLSLYLSVRLSVWSSVGFPSSWDKVGRDLGWMGGAKVGGEVAINRNAATRDARVARWHLPAVIMFFPLTTPPVCATRCNAKKPPPTPSSSSNVKTGDEGRFIIDEEGRFNMPKRGRNRVPRSAI